MRPLRMVAGSIPVLMIALPFAATPVFAQEGEGPINTPAGLIFRIVNSAVVIALFVWAFKKCAPLFRKHADEISEKIAEGTRAREAAERQRQEIKAKLAGLETEIQQLRDSGKREAAARSCSVARGGEGRCSENRSAGQGGHRRDGSRGAAGVESVDSG